MNIQGAWDCYKSHSTRLSDVMRQATFAGVAIVWVAKDSQPKSLSGWLGAALVLFVVGLIADAAQYAALTRSWEKFCNQKEDELEKAFPDVGERNKQDFDAPDDINVHGVTLFWVKVTLMALGAGFLLVHLFVKLFGSPAGV